MNFLKVWTELDDGKFKSLPAKVVSKNPKGVLTIRYLSSTSKKTTSGKRLYTYETETYEITEDSIVQKVDSELTLGYEELISAPGYFVKFDYDGGDQDEDDEDYVPCSSSEDDDDSSSNWSSSSEYIDESASEEEEEEEPPEEEEYIDEE